MFGRLKSLFGSPQVPVASGITDAAAAPAVAPVEVRLRK